MSYAESKKKLDAIRQEYGCKGDLIFRTAIQNVIDYGKSCLLDKSWYKCTMDDIDAEHDRAEKENKFIWCTREFEKAIVDCSVALCGVAAYDLLTYIQREVWLGGGKVGEPDYQRAMEIIRNCLCYTSDCYGTYAEDCASTLRKFREMDLTDEEIAFFGWEYLFDVEDEEDEEE
jgi:hypothetical protein